MQSVEIHNTFNVLTLSARMTVAHFLSIYVAIAILCSRVVAYCVNESSVVWINERQPSIIGTFVNCLIYTQDAMIAPYYTTAKIINVSTEIFLNNLIKVDEVTSTVTLDFFFVTYWVSSVHICTLYNVHYCMLHINTYCISNSHNSLLFKILYASMTTGC